MTGEGRHDQAETSVLVTGGTGFVGRALVDRLIGDGARVRVLGRRPMPRWREQPSVEHVRADIADEGTLDRVLHGVREVYHLAAATSGDWAAFRGVTIEASRRLLASLERQGGGRVVFVSSLGNYDGGLMQDGGVIDETFSLERNGEGRGNYARAKTEAERIAQGYLGHPRVHLTIVRPGVIYGPGVANPVAGAAFAVAGRILVVLGRGDKRLPLVYVDDVVEALVMIMRSAATIGKIYNLVHPEQPSQREYLAVYRRVFEDRRPVILFPLAAALSALRAAEHLVRPLRQRQLAYKAARLLKRVSYDATAVQRDIGFQPRVDSQQGIERMRTAGRRHA